MTKFTLVTVSVFLLVAARGALSNTDEEIRKLKEMNVLFGRQIMMHQVFNEERARSEGQSGVKQKRRMNSGTKPYHADGVSHGSFIHIHDHADYKSAVGIGEFIAVLNGIEFRTRHNDYRLYKSVTNDKSFHASEPIVQPEVPPEVLSKKTVKEQVTEMREWFKAFRDANHTVRDYRQYFKPIMCYLEGGWTIPNGDEIDEPFVSDRHQIDATGWLELHRKIRFMSNTGSKDNLENFAFLPTALIDMKNDTTPVFAQWNYRIMCHEPSMYIYRNRIRMVDDLHVRVARGHNKLQYENTRAARFELNLKDSPVWEETYTRGTKFMDLIMKEIPGWDNYGVHLEDNSFGLHAKDLDDASIPLNVANYHRQYVVTSVGANGRQERARGFTDDGVYMAMNTQERVVTNYVENKCTRDSNGVRVCAENYSQKWTYAIPLEIVYLTPLHNWNPYNIEYNEDGKQCSTCKGGNTTETAYQFATNKHYYITPESFYSGSADNGDPADSSTEAVGMLNKDGNLRKVRATGTYITMPYIKDVGVIRVRYPIAPVHQENSLIWKEFQALKDLLLAKGARYNDLRKDYNISTEEGDGKPDIKLRLDAAPANENTSVSLHTHELTLTAGEDEKVKSGTDVFVYTSEDNAHSHYIQVRYNISKPRPYFYRRCDEQDDCWDKHYRYMSVITLEP